MKKSKKHSFGAAYYFGQKRTQHIQLSLWQVYGVCSVICLAFVWGVVSFIWLLNLNFAHNKLEDRYQQAREQVFEMQVMYDHTFEKAYNDETYRLQLASLSASKKDSEQQHNNAENGEKNAVAYDLKYAQKEFDSVMQSIDDIIKKETQELVVEHLSLKPLEQNLEVEFQLFNRNKKKKAKGYFWLTLHADSQDKVFVYPRGVRLVDEGKFADFHNARRYSLRNFSEYKLKIDATYQLKGLDKAYLYIADAEGSVLIRKKIEIEKNATLPLSS